MSLLTNISRGGEESYFVLPLGDPFLGPSPPSHILEQVDFTYPPVGSPGPIPVPFSYPVCRSQLFLGLDYPVCRILFSC